MSTNLYTKDDLIAFLQSIEGDAVLVHASSDKHVKQTHFDSGVCLSFWQETRDSPANIFIRAWDYSKEDEK